MRKYQNKSKEISILPNGKQDPKADATPLFTVSSKPKKEVRGYPPLPKAVPVPPAPPRPPDPTLVTNQSGATSSHFSDFNFNATYEGARLTSLRFKSGNQKHERNNPVYDEANWLKAYKNRDVAFFRDRAGHAMEHLIDEMRGKDDPDPGGNLGAVGWLVDILAFVKKNDPHLYGAIQGKWRLDDEKAETHRS